MIIEADDIYLAKAKYSDWPSIYESVWSRPECARFMFWDITTSEADARARMQRTIAFQATHDMYFVYEKRSGRAIGYAGVERIAEGKYQEAAFASACPISAGAMGGRRYAALSITAKAAMARRNSYTARKKAIPHPSRWRNLQVFSRLMGKP